jgi:hypothetical protein
MILRATAPAAAVIADAVLRPIGVVGVPGAEFVLDVGIILTPLVDVLDDQRNRRPGRHLLAVIVREHTRCDAHLVRLAPLGRESRLARPAPIEEMLDVPLRQRNLRRTTIYNAANRVAVALSPRRHTQQVSECVV